MGAGSYPIGTAARLAGLSPHAIRTWERRYGALTPGRTDTNRRLYSDGDVRRLRMLARAVAQGHSIGRIAGLPTEDLARLVGASTEDTAGRATGLEAADSLSVHLAECVEAVRALDPEALESALTRAARDLGATVAIENVIVPLIEDTGEGWRTGRWRIVHEHLATTVVRTYLGRLLDLLQPARSAPAAIASTPAGHVHELGALLASVAAAADGWSVLYLGPNLPAEEIAAAARHSGARAVLLSIVYPPDDARVVEEVLTLRRLLDEGVTVFVGGRAARHYETALGARGVRFPGGLQELRAELTALRTGRQDGHSVEPG